MATRDTTLYKYVPLKCVTSILDNHRLYLSDGSNFNDPFETTVTDKKSGAITHVSGLHILCLSNSIQNKLIWSHYADSHKGVCLTVNVPADLVYPMCYTTKRVYTDSDLDGILKNGHYHCKKNLKKPFDPLNYNKKIAFIKDRKWSYEREYRIVFDKNDESGLVYEDDKWFMSVKIKNVYLGVNFDKNDISVREKIIDACKRNKVKISQMVLSVSDYSVKVGR